MLKICDRAPLSCSLSTEGIERWSVQNSLSRLLPFFFLRTGDVVAVVQVVETTGAPNEKKHRKKA